MRSRTRRATHGCAAIASLIGVLFSSVAGAQTQPDTVYLVDNCLAAGKTHMVDCFTSVDELHDGIWNPATATITPSENEPLLVEVGAGKFTGSLSCPSGGGWVTFRGVGRERSLLLRETDPPSGSGAVPVLRAEGCESLEFSDLTIRSEPPSGDGHAVVWLFGGSSNWTNVDLIGEDGGWYDVCFGSSSDPPDAEHYFWGAKITAGRAGIVSTCGDIWFYGGEILTDVGAFNPAASPLAAVAVHVVHRSIVRVFGSALRVRISDGTGIGAGYAYGARAGAQVPAFPVGEGSGHFHMHGGIVNVNAGNVSGLGSVGIEADSGVAGTGDALAHTPGTAFVIAGGSVNKRLSGPTCADDPSPCSNGTGNLQSPFLWQSATDEPAPGLASVDGRDLFVDTDSGPTGSDPHLMIYSTACEGDPAGDGTPWFDVVEGTCRQ